MNKSSIGVRMLNRGIHKICGDSLEAYTKIREYLKHPIPEDRGVRRHHWSDVKEDNHHNRRMI